MRRQERGTAAWHRLLRAISVLAIAHTDVDMTVSVLGPLSARRHFTVSDDTGQRIAASLAITNVQETLLQRGSTHLRLYWTEQLLSRPLILSCNGKIVAGHFFDVFETEGWQPLYQHIVLVCEVAKSVKDVDVL